MAGLSTRERDYELGMRPLSGHDLLAPLGYPAGMSSTWQNAFKDSFNENGNNAAGACTWVRSSCCCSATQIPCSKHPFVAHH